VCIGRRIRGFTKQFDAPGQRVNGQLPVIKQSVDVGPKQQSTILMVLTKSRVSVEMRGIECTCRTWTRYRARRTVLR
jgi:hypothetical protein